MKFVLQGTEMTTVLSIHTQTEGSIMNMTELKQGSLNKENILSKYRYRLFKRLGRHLPVTFPRE